MDKQLSRAQQRDRNVWDSCVHRYEEHVVCGHPDIVAYEAFEEDFLDRLLLYLVRERGRSVQLFDVGCGSGRLHLRYGLKTANDADLDPDSAEKLRRARQSLPVCGYDPLLARRLRSVGGLDFSEHMIELAKEKLVSAGLGALIGSKLFFRVGSAFELGPLKKYPLPVVVSLCNSIGVMQGPSGAAELFKTMRRAVEAGGGIALISGYLQEAAQAFALSNYESTMDVCGQPLWLEPDTYADSRHIQVPQGYRRAHGAQQTLSIDVFDRKGRLVKQGFMLRRDKAAVKQVIKTGHIQTHTDYESYWYSADQFDAWINEYWPKGMTYHLIGKSIDALRAEPVQLAVLDVGGRLKGLLERWQAV
ncbi:MAG TPA: class I SAM-dependent methyltransferase [bacterium]|nr:class I SAM-dependent methyltransferase [bacterium]